MRLLKRGALSMGAPRTALSTEGGGRSYPRRRLRGGDRAFGGRHLALGHAGRARYPRALVIFTLLACTLLTLGGALPQHALADGGRKIVFANGGTATLHEDGSITGTLTLDSCTRSGYSMTSYAKTQENTAYRCKLHLPDGSVVDGCCYDAYSCTPNHTAMPGPAEGSYSFTATSYNPLTKEDLGGSWFVVVHSENAKAHPLYKGEQGPRRQAICNAFSLWQPELNGSLELTKTSTVLSITRGNASYTLEGASYGLYEDKACTRLKATLVTDGAGQANATQIPPGTYFLRETSASRGFALDKEVHEVKIETGKASKLAVQEAPQLAHPTLLLRKVDTNTGAAVAQGAASLGGARYHVSYYGGSHTLKDLPKKPTRSWTFSTDSDGRIPFDAAHCVEGDELFQDGSGKPCLPLGTFVIEEAKASEGYTLGEHPRYLVEVTGADASSATASYEAPTDGERVARGDVILQKRDAESGATTPLGSASFEGVTFEVTNDSAAAVVVNGVSYAPGRVCATLVAGSDGVAKTEGGALPYGSYTVREKSAGRGYFVNSSWKKSFRIGKDGDVIRITGDDAVRDQVIRGDLALTKHDAGADGGLMPGVPFLVTSRSTGERHVVVTDENGMIDTSSSWNKHTEDTNGNDRALVAAEDGTLSVDESKLNPAAGIWFGSYPADDGRELTKPDDALGALPYDRTADGGGYDIEELPCAANRGHRMVKTTVSITRNARALNLGSFDDAPIVLATTLTDADGRHVAPATPDLKLTDVVTYDGLVPGRDYLLVGELHAFSSAGEDLGTLVTSQVSFTAQTAKGTQEVPFSLDASAHAGQHLVAFEQVKEGGTVIAEHADPTDGNQTVYLPSLATSATGTATGGHDVAAAKNGNVSDVVSYEGLEPGQAYELAGALHLLKADGSDGGVVAKAQATLVPKAPSGSAVVTFDDVDLSGYAGGTLVAFEALSCDGQVLATHEDLSDASQSVHVPRIATKAHGSHASGTVYAASGETIVDTVSYEGLLPETDYELVATLHLASEEGKDEGPLGTSVTTTFTTPKAPRGSQVVSGSVEVSIPADLSSVSGRSVVAFEELVRCGVTLASHADITDEGQTVRVPALATEATCAGSHDAGAEKDQVIIDAVGYQGLAAGESYKLHGTLMAFPADGGDPYELAGADCLLTPTAPTGTQKLTFPEVDLSGLAGGRVVAFERLSLGEEVVASHDDQTDSAQTVFVPSISTEATGESGTHATYAGAAQTITDHVSYEHLLPNTEYTATATLHLVEFDAIGRQKDGGALSDPVTVTFTTPEATDGAPTVSGSIDVPVTTSLEGHEGSDVVAFEVLSRGETILARHEDISDDDQTVHVPQVSTQVEADQGKTKDGESHFIDRVTYQNLVPGTEYEAAGTLHVVSADGKDEGVVRTADGSAYTARVTFVPGNADGSIEVPFAVDVATLGLDGKKAVVFEELSCKKVIVARHADAHSAPQTVAFEGSKAKPAETRPHFMPQTGDEGFLLAIPFILSGAAALALAGLLRARHR